MEIPIYFIYFLHLPLAMTFQILPTLTYITITNNYTNRTVRFWWIDIVGLIVKERRKVKVGS